MVTEFSEESCLTCSKNWGASLMNEYEVKKNNDWWLRMGEISTNGNRDEGVFLKEVK